MILPSLHDLMLAARYSTWRHIGLQIDQSRLSRSKSPAIGEDGDWKLETCMMPRKLGKGRPTGSDAFAEPVFVPLSSFVSYVFPDLAALTDSPLIALATISSLLLEWRDKRAGIDRIMMYYIQSTVKYLISGDS